MPELEIYPSAPLRFVALAIRFGFVPQLAAAEGQATVFERLKDDFPLAEPGTNVEVTLWPGGSTGPQQKQNLRMKNRERTWSVSVAPEVLAVNTSKYVDFEDFIGTVQRAVKATFDSGITTVHRVGIRYIDEIKVSGVTEPEQWSPYIDERLLGGIAFAEETLRQCRGRWVLPSARTATCSSVTARTGTVVDPKGPLLLEPIEGSVFVLDMDSFWQQADDAVAQSLSAEEIGEIFVGSSIPPPMRFSSARSPRNSARRFSERRAMPDSAGRVATGAQLNDVQIRDAIKIAVDNLTRELTVRDRPTPAQLVTEASDARDKSRFLHEDATEIHETAWRRRLDERTTRTAQRAPAELLHELSRESGDLWTLIARLTEVSATAVRKWRRGESITPQNRRELARLVSF